MEISLTIFVAYVVIGLILGLILTTFGMDTDDTVEKSMALMAMMLFWGIAIVIGGIIVFFAGLVKGADWLKWQIEDYRSKNTQKT